ncbi:MAG TPA: hypothetical protein VHQ22_02480 [Terriglobales bacterium]|jgi:hypothetical protein|nr:hypothetical protein [Terriglobales bacterium]
MIESLNELFARILEEHSPSEVAVFKAVGSELITNGLNKHHKSGRALTEYDFALDLDSGLLLLHLLAGTLSLVEIYAVGKRLKYEKSQQAEIQATWEEFLIKNGVPRFLAKQIQARYGVELFRIIVSHQEKEDA